MSQPELSMSFWLWLARLWPIVPPLVFLLILRGRIAQQFSFLVLGSFICLGTQWLVAQVALLFPPTSDDGAFIAEQMLDVIAVAVVQMLLLSLALSLPLLWWLHRGLRAPPAPPPLPRRRKARQPRATEPVPSVAQAARPTALN
jgi:hypothetical protein